MRIPAGGLLAALALWCGAFAATARAETVQAANKRVVLAMWRGAIERGDEAVVLRYVAPDYIQHNVNVSPGRAGFLAGVRAIAQDLRAGRPSLHKQLAQLLTVVAERDRVVLVWNQPQPDPTTPGATYPGQAFDMFRLRHGRIVEHWDDTRKRAQPDH